ncbi:alpha-mannosidase [Curtobacterium citreum]|uniref:Glycosyl hydrolase-related protein n=1 Tax=Curtobacterium citreum TaxID=2036 RepID=A0ABT2HCU6_9MICO|nr:glycoside hydrolase family 38 C-terminal domain-containing protein [Curtobacterium citreum]MCS6521069.1 glycosyl hydrolase-related protein [Curtobacterium citreum]TQJ27923.1 alpha-mannosidase [Curtobacterium citreum]GGL71034.1 alpha-mannosidase [Curtobacterium citreum]
MHQNQQLVEARIERVLNERIVPAVHQARTPVTLAAWQVPDEPVPAAEALAAEYRPFAVGESWGRAWSTWWFEVTGAVPAEWAGRTVELLVDPGFQGDWPGNQAEGLLHTPDGTPVKGIHPRNHHLRITDRAVGGEQVHLYLEMAANPDILVNEFVPTTFGSKRTAPETPIYTFRTAELAVFEPEVWALRFDVEVLFQMVKELPEADPRRHEVLRDLERAMDVLALDDVVGTAAAARAELAGALASPANPSAHRLSGIGHAHIDTAWLWPIRETKRKTGRTFSNVLALAEQYPDFKFAASSAQQYAWVKERYPTVFAGIKAAIARGQWIVVGSQWIEPDGNLPGGEAMVRQVTQGLRFFADELDVETHGIWLPDSFGYTAAFPQIAKLAGLEWFLTQKLSWNQTNTFPHHTFWWEGIDGSRIFTHFPPIDTYNATLEGEELHHAVRQFREKGAATTSLVPFGYGDGGGGPIREMMERQRRVESLEGSPRVEVEHPDDFFARAREEYPDAPVWVGELYLELHRGTFTSHAREKRGNRRAEHLLREAELWSTAAALQGAPYPYECLDELWQATLLQQFHDILPGSSIRWVHEENEESYRRNHAEIEQLTARALAHLGAAGVVANAADHDRRELVLDAAGTPVGVVEARAHALSPLTVVTPEHPVTATQGADGTVLDNGLVRVHVDGDGLVHSIVDLAHDRELVPADRSANLLHLHEDLPNAWDAWDVDAHYRRSVVELRAAESVELTTDGDLRAVVRVRRVFGSSELVQTIAVHADDVRVHLGVDLEWREREKLLKASLPFVVHAQHHSAEIQFGHLRRPTHTNTSWDDARFEVMAHRWVHVEEPGYGVGVTNAGTYGHDVTRRVGVHGEVETEVRLSLVRGAQSPDPEQDLGHHTFAYSVHPGADVAAVVASGYDENLPLRVVPVAGDTAADGTGASVAAPVVSSSPGVRVESVKLADDRSGDVVVRLYEALGARSDTELDLRIDAVAVEQVDLRERPLADPALTARRFAWSGGTVALGLRPFQVMTLRIRPRGA